MTADTRRLRDKQPRNMKATDQLNKLVSYSATEHQFTALWNWRGGFTIQLNELQKSTKTTRKIIVLKKAHFVHSVLV